MPEIYRLVTKEFPLAHFSFEVIRGAYDHALVRAVSVDEYRALIETLTDLCRADDAVFHRHLDLHRSALATMQQKTQIVPCVAGKDFIVLDACGNIYPCEMLPAFANVRAIDYNFANVVGDPRWQQTLATIAAKQCHCPHLCFLFASLEAMRGTL